MHVISIEFEYIHQRCISHRLLKDYANLMSFFYFIVSIIS